MILYVPSIKHLQEVNGFRKKNLSGQDLVTKKYIDSNPHEASNSYMFRIYESWFLIYQDVYHDLFVCS